MRIACDDCAMQDTDHCRDCIVTFIIERDEDAVVIDAEEIRALRALRDGGLVPDLGFVPKDRDTG
ncbi:MAG TPA: hypothetical protein VEA19_07790 [Actinomycetota bacterium]|nr:hypothetical protein [Actinomycetota bacterium]